MKAKQLFPHPYSIHDYVAACQVAGDLRAYDRMAERIGEKAPDLRLISPGLSTRVNGMEGPIADGELPKYIDFGKKNSVST